MRKAVFLDRDGTIIKDVHHLCRKERIRLLPNAVKAIELFNRAGWFIVVISNQPVIAYGMTNEDAVIEINEEIQKRFERRGARIDVCYFCPHHPEGKVSEYTKICQCRKPAIGLIKKAAKEWQIDLASSAIVGDMQNDILAGKNAGLFTIKVLTGYGKKTHFGYTGRKSDIEKLEQVQPDLVCRDLFEAAKYLTTHF